uniref:Uncharacterized protein n=1 Tax=Sphaerodactylus townsendi TaxID=933632 RepID=A0ACB8GBE2_9SAUR
MIKALSEAWPLPFPQNLGSSWPALPRLHFGLALLFSSSQCPSGCSRTLFPTLACLFGSKRTPTTSGTMCCYGIDLHSLATLALPEEAADCSQITNARLGNDPTPIAPQTVFGL